MKYIIKHTCKPNYNLLEKSKYNLDKLSDSFYNNFRRAFDKYKSETNINKDKYFRGSTILRNFICSLPPFADNNIKPENCCLHHIDHNHSNNSYDNLILIVPELDDEGKIKNGSHTDFHYKEFIRCLNKFLENNDLKEQEFEFKDNKIVGKYKDIMPEFYSFYLDEVKNFTDGKDKFYFYIADYLHFS